jgi:hypothetical protein
VTPPTEQPTTSLARRWVAAFGRFWWEFLVGDTPELLVGAVLAVAIVALLAHHGAARALTVGALPVLVVVMLGTSVRRAARAARRPRRPES